MWTMGAKSPKSLHSEYSWRRGRSECGNNTAVAKPWYPRHNRTITLWFISLEWKSSPGPRLKLQFRSNVTHRCDTRNFVKVCVRSQGRSTWGNQENLVSSLRRWQIYVYTAGTFQGGEKSIWLVLETQKNLQFGLCEELFCRSVWSNLPDKTSKIATSDSCCCPNHLPRVQQESSGHDAGYERLHSCRAVSTSSWQVKEWSPKNGAKVSGAHVNRTMSVCPSRGCPAEKQVSGLHWRVFATKDWFERTAGRNPWTMLASRTTAAGQPTRWRHRLLWKTTHSGS